MCSLSWSRDSESRLDLYFNRDELKTRAIAEAPRFYQEDGVCFLSPRDPNGGGTWMLANEFGLVVCLLNKWELEGRVIETPRSRGRLVWGLGKCRSLDEIEEALPDLDDYQAFTLVAFSRDEERRWEWDGERVLREKVPPFFTSSSYCFEEVKEARAARARMGLTGEELHSSVGEEISAYSVRMNRPDAQTWSRSRLQVGEKISWEYLAEQADLQGEPEITKFALVLR